MPVPLYKMYANSIYRRTWQTTKINSEYSDFQVNRGKTFPNLSQQIYIFCASIIFSNILFSTFEFRGVSKAFKGTAPLRPEVSTRCIGYLTEPEQTILALQLFEKLRIHLGFTVLQ